jgi:anti-sigma regulatory factor (Ser/Thr protein kinase)
MTLGDEVRRGHLSHSAVVYDDDQQLLDAAVPFLRAGVAGGETTLLSVGDRERSLILGGLGDPSGIDAVAPWAATAAFTTLRQNHRLITDRPSSAGRVRILGEVPGTAETISWAAWVRYETAINHVYSDLPVSMMCAYDRRSIPGAVLDDVIHTHPLLSASDTSAENSRFVQPTSFLEQLSARDVDDVESEPPDIVLVAQLPGPARRSVAALAETVGLRRPTVDAMALAVGEVVTNALMYGGPPVVVRAWAPPDRVVVSVLDHGSGPDDPFIGMLPVPMSAGGLGLHVAYQTCSLVTMTRGDQGFTVHLTMCQSPD